MGFQLFFKFIFMHSAYELIDKCVRQNQKSVKIEI